MGKEAEAMATAVLSLDASRRVGWARAFDYEERLDSALQDANIWRGDRDAFRKGLSFMYGLFMEWTKNERSELFRRVLDEVAGYDAVLDRKLVSAGRRRAVSIRENDVAYQEEMELQQSVKQATKRRMQNGNSRMWKNATAQVEDGYVAKYGFSSVEEMREVLAKWQMAAGRAEREREAVREERFKREYAQRQERRRERSA